MDIQSFYDGKCFDAYGYLGCHLVPGGAVFRVYAPSARDVRLIGEFNGWQEAPMRRVRDGRFWEAEIPGAWPGMMYKYRVLRPDGRAVDHCDPFGFGMQLRPESASIVRDAGAYRFGDGEWMRRRTDGRQGPVNIYEVHAGSWMRHAGRGNTWYTFGELADRLIPYVKAQGFNYIEMMPLSEHPLDGSWGYQVSCPYSPTSRHGAMDDLKAFVDRCHRADVGVLLDIVPVHFAVDDYALAEFDGTALFEYPRPEAGISEWGSLNYNHARGEVRSYLQSNANYWLTEYHFDGLRMDAVRNLLYRQGDESRGENREGAEFLRTMNRGLKALHPTAMLIAEDSTAFPGVTRPVDAGGLGFDYKWDLGWMNDTLAFLAEAPADRPAGYHRLTFSMMYFYDERFLLPLSHDEVVHGKGTIAGRMHGDYAARFPQARLLYALMLTHPGKKLNFMGNEFAQLREWDEAREQDWLLLQYPLHEAFQRFTRDVNRLYLDHPALFAWDYDRRGFEWIDCHREAQCVYAWLRTDGRERLAVFFNASDRVQVYRPKPGSLRGLRLLIDSDSATYGGHGDSRLRCALDGSAEALALAPFSAQIYAVAG